MSKRAEEAALKAYPQEMIYGESTLDGKYDGNATPRYYYIKAYEQAEKDTIERALKWLKFNVDTYTWYNEMNGESGISEDFFEDFKKEMEED